MKIQTLMITSLAAGALLIAGCSSSSTNGKGSGGSASGTSSTASSSTASSSGTSSSAASSPAAGGSTTASAEGEKARIAGIPIRPGELPAGWKAGPVDSNTAAQDAAQQAEIAKCVGAKARADQPVARVETNWVQGDDEISSNAQAIRTDADLQADLALLKNSKTNSCYGQVARQSIARSLPSGATIKSFDVAITPGNGGGPSDVVAAGHAVISVSNAGRTVTIYEDFFFIAGKRIEAETDFTGVGHRLDTALEKKVVTAVARRVAAA